jgi:hypothetical protein
MPGRAFIPGPLAQAQPRVYKSFRGRQVKGLLLAAAGTALGLLVVGAKDASSYAFTFALALPGFAYGWFQPEGKPVEYWLQVLLRYYLTPQQFGAVRQPPRWRQLMSRAVLMARAALRARRMARRKVTRRFV